MGYRASKYEFVVTDIIGPGEKAIHGLASFKPDQAYQKKEVARLYEESSCGETYLGDWHTHPHSHPYLSLTDKSTINSIAKHPAARLTNPLMLVAAPPGQESKIWVYEKSTKSNHQYVQADIVIF